MRAFLYLLRSKLRSSRYYISRQKLLFLSIGIIGLGIGLVLAKLLCNILSSPDRLSLSDIKAIFWLGIGIVLLGVVGFCVLKHRILWVSIGIIGVGVGLVLAASLLAISSSPDILISPEIIDMLFGLGIAIVGIGVMLAWVFHERVVAVIGIIVAIVGAILTDLSGDRLLSSVGNIAKNTKNIGDIGTTLKDVKKHTHGFTPL